MSEKSTLYERVMSVLPCIIITALVLIPVGIGFLCTVNTTGKVTHVGDYSSCEAEDEGVPCNTLRTCTCHHPILLKEDLIGDVTLYYELDFDQNNSSYASSRDDAQLTGHPGDTPAESCGAYRFDEENRTIFPCGEVADSMFNDTFYGLRVKDTVEDLPVSYSGILAADTATATYHNPPKNVTEKFVKPKSWSTGPPYSWERSNSTGVENEAFRAWMDTSLKRKPVWRLLPRDNSTSLPAGDYTIRIDIWYPFTRYNGSRRIILEGVYPETRTSHAVIGGIALIIGLVALVAGVVLIIISKKKDEKNTICNDATLPVGDRKSHRPRTNDLEDISEETRLNKHN